MALETTTIPLKVGRVATSHDATRYTEGEFSVDAVEWEGNYLPLSYLNEFDARVLDNIFKGQIDASDISPNGTSYSYYFSQLTIESVEDYLTMLSDYGKEEGVNTNESQRLAFNVDATFEINAPETANAAVLNITFIDANGEVAYPTTADGYFDVTTVDNTDSTTTITLDFSDDQYVVESGSIIRSEMQYGDTRLVVNGDLLTNAGTGIASITFAPTTAAEATVVPDEYLITLTYI